MPVRSEPFNIHRFRRYAKDLSEAVDAMRFRITEPTFFWGKHREVGDVMEAPTGPYRNFATGGGLQRIPQFVEMPDEIKQILTAADVGNATDVLAAPAMPPSNAAPGPMPAAAPSIVNAAPVKVAPKANPLAVRIRALTTRRAKFQDEAAAILAEGETAMTAIEANGPAVLKRASQASSDELTAITDLATSLKELDATNGGPLEG